MLFRPGVDIRASVPHTGARDSRNRFRMSSNGESADDPRDTRAVAKLDGVGPELDGNSSGNSSTTGARSPASALQAPPIVV